MKRKSNNPFAATRTHHSTEAAEDYCELILALTEKMSEARTTEIAKNLGVSHVTAIRTMRRLGKEGYLKTEKHKPIELTQKGLKLARYCKERHELVINFLLRIGVPKNVAELDAEGMEHHVSPITLQRIRYFLSAKS